MQVTKQKELVRQTEAEPNTKAEGLLDCVLYLLYFGTPFSLC